MSKEDFVNGIIANLKAITPRETDIEKEETTRAQRLNNEFMLNVPTVFKKGLLSDLDDKLIQSTNSIIYGLYGVGKTHTAYSLARWLYINGKIRTYKVVREIEIINELRENSLAGNKFIAYDFLVIDEFGKINDSDYTKAQIFNILDNRNDWQKKTLLICNADNIEGLRKIIPNALKDRYKHNKIFMGGKSKR